jgi:hypothetical protein
VFLVEIFGYASFFEGGAPTLLGRIEKDETGGDVRLIDCVPKLEDDLRRGILGSGGLAAGLVRMEDGMAFLEALQYEFSGAVVRASEVKRR